MAFTGSVPLTITGGNASWITKFRSHGQVGDCRSVVRVIERVVWALGDAALRRILGQLASWPYDGADPCCLCRGES